MKSHKLTPAQVARVAFVVAFASTVDAFRPVSLGTFTPSLRTTGVTMRNDLVLRKPSASSKSLLGLRASASNPFTESLEKAYNEPSATFSRERMYELAQVIFCSRYVLLKFVVEKLVFFHRKTSTSGMRPSRPETTTKPPLCTRPLTLPSFRLCHPNLSVIRTELAVTSRISCSVCQRAGSPRTLCRALPRTLTSTPGCTPS